MIACLDVQYAERSACVACVGIAAWDAADSVLECVRVFDGAPAAYEPGSFYKRELPYLMAMIAEVEERVRLEAIVVDGHAWLDAGHAGLGARLHEALDARVTVVGVAKTAYRDGIAVPVLRGASGNALYVSAVGMAAADAAACVRAMHGAHRMPTALGRVDRLARGTERADARKRGEGGQSG